MSRTPPGGSRKRAVSQATTDDIKAVMGDYEFQTTEQIAERMGQNTEATSQKLRRLYDRHLVERMMQPLDDARFKWLWRAVPDGYEAPLFDAQQGIDGRALDECLGGHTYLKTNGLLEKRA